jgi:hypothetical protein
MTVPSTIVGSLVANVVMAAIATAAVALRFYARRIKNQPWKWDDYTILVACVRNDQPQTFSYIADDQI